MKTVFVFALFLGTCGALHGADSPPGKSYKVDFTVREAEGGKTISSHSYSMRAETGQPDNVGSIRTGSKVPTSTGVGNAEPFSYIEVGVNIDVRRFREAEGVVYLGVSAEVSSVADRSPEKLSRPIIRQNRWNSMVSAKVGKPTIIFSSDDVSSKRQLIVEVSATPVQ